MTPRTKEARNKAASNKTPLVIAIVLVVVAIIGIAAVIATRGGDDEPTLAEGETAPTNPVPDELAGEVRPMTVEGSALPPLPSSGDDTAVGLTAPALVGESFDGSAVTTASEGGPVMVVFLAHWCPHCNNEIPRLIELEETGRFPDDLKIIAVSTAARADAPNFPPSEWIVDMGWPWPVMVDDVDTETGIPVGAEAFGVNSFPFITVVGADATVLARWSGESEPDDFIAKLDAALVSLPAE
ncbi:MAG TPA: TlpA disulfide reductase family protein [Ilumatobacteraceae bacterium]|nr:TlpA disulfide reductase family protein [Ilumatobacteraceae bacterium]